MRKIVLLFFILLGVSPAFSQDTVLQNYIQTALKRNLSFNQKQNNLRKAESVLKEANAQFLPQLSFRARYSVSEGGRTFDVPAGDLLNPVYEYLHTVSSQLLPNNPFPNIRVDNQSFPILRPHEQETYVELVQPLFNQAIYKNRKIRLYQLKAEGKNIEAEKNDLIYEVKKAYYDYWSAQEYYNILKATLSVLEENLRVSERLYSFDKVTMKEIYSAQAELSKFKSQMSEAEANLTLAKRFFNLMLNRTLTADIKAQDNPDTVLRLLAQEYYINMALAKRTEIGALENLYMASESYMGLSRGNYLPDLSLLGMAGIEGEEYGVGKDYNFASASLVLRWKIFEGGSRKQKMKQAQLQKENVLLQKEEVIKQIQLDVVNAYQNCMTAFQQHLYSKDALKAAKAAFRLEQKRYALGQSSQLEFKQMRADYTSAQKEMIITKYKYLQSYAKLKQSCGISH